MLISMRLSLSCRPTKTAVVLSLTLFEFLALVQTAIGQHTSPSATQPHLAQATNTWVKRSPLPGSPPSPRLGYEGACAWDSTHQRLIRYGGHNQGGGGEQHAEVWTFDPVTARWTLHEPNISPPGICCGQQNLFDPVQGRYLRFPAFSGSHGWQWWREIYLNDASVWSYDLASNTWRNHRPIPTPRLAPLRCATWDTQHQVAVVFGGENSTEGTLVYDPYANIWTSMEPSLQPGFRSGGNMAYDAAWRVHILFGAQFTDDPHTWAYDLRRNEWRDLRPQVMPSTDKNDAVLTYDPFSRQVLALVKLTEGKDEEATHRLETWTFDGGANRWTKMNPATEPNASGNRARVLSFAPEFNLALLENRTHSKTYNEQQIWTYRLADMPDAPPLQPPAGLQVATEPNGAVLSWTANPSTNAVRYAIYRGEGGQPWQAEWTKLAQVDAQQNTYHDRPLKPGAVYYYAVRSVGSDGAEGADSVKVRTQPPIIEDVVVSVVSTTRIALRWNYASLKDLSGFVVERAAVGVLSEDQLRRLKGQTPPLPEPSVGLIHEIGQFVRLTKSLLRERSYLDTTADLAMVLGREGEPSPIYQRTIHADQLDKDSNAYRFGVYAYRIRAVNALGVESGPSPTVFTIPSAPQWLFAREQGTACQLKWAANPEQKLNGYRVYRMDGRYDKDPIRRLTPQATSSLTFEDPAAGTATRRYYVVAVDTLGQEGFPSSPVWFEREWKAYYQRFIGEWHQ